MTREHPGVHKHPRDEDPAEQADESPAPAELRHFVRNPFAERHRRLEFLMHDAADPPATRDLRDNRVLDL